jgi:diketogulonate reductase-like aldo/keto reductase
MPSTIQYPRITLNNGVELPAIGLGVFQSPPTETAAAVEAAIRTGYRLIDTAAAYGNEREVGEGIRRAGIARDEIFIETKIWISDYGYEATLHAFDKSARKLGIDQIDLLILHQPLPSAFDRTLGAYRALERLLADAKVRAIGVSNFMPEHLEHLLTEASVVPAVNQIEVHPYFQQKALQRVHAKHGIATQAWSPIGGITSYRGMQKRSFDAPTLLEIAKRYGKSAAPGDAALAFAGRALRDPKVGQAGAHRRELRRLRLRADARGDRRHRRPGYRCAGRARAGEYHTGELRPPDPRGLSR